jgi:sulfur carrier protein ThiS
MWSNNYVGIPFKYKGRTKDGLDCWGLARLIYKNEYDITLPSLSTEYEDNDIARITDLIAQYKEGWESVSTPSEGDVVLFRIMGSISHIGVAISSTHFIHAREGFDSAVEAFESPYWKRRIVGYFKYSQNKGALLNAVPHPLRTERYTVPIPSGTTLELLANWIIKEYEVSEDIKSKITILVNGRVVDKSEWPNTILKDTDVVEYRSVPLGGNTTRMLLTIAVIVASVMFGPEVGAMMGFTEAAGYTAAQSAAFGTLAISVTGTVLINYIAPIRPPDLGGAGKDAGSAERALILNGGQNKANPYGAIPVVLGKTRITPPLGSVNYLSYESERNSYLSMLLTWGYGPLTIDEESFRIGEQPLNNYTDYTLVTLDRKVDETQEEIDNFNAIYGKDITQINTNLELVCDGNPETSVPAGPWAEAISTEVVDAVTFAIHFPQGLRKIRVRGDGAGDSYSAPTSFELQYFLNNEWHDFETITLGADSPKKDAFTYTKTYSRYASAIVLPVNTGLTVRIRRTTGDNTEDNDSYRYSHASYLQTVTFTRNATPAIDPLGSKIAKSALKIKATDQLNGSIEGVNAIVQTYCKSWNGTTWAVASTNNPADLFRYVLEHSGNSQRITNPDSKFNLTQLQHWHTYCVNNNFQYNAVIGAQRSILEVLRDICAAGRASPALVDGKWTVNIDEEKTTVVQHFTPHNSWGFESTKVLPKLPDGLRVTYFDEDNNYQESEIIVYASGKNENNSSIFEAIQLPGVTHKASVIDHARWHMAQAKLRPEVYTLNSDIEYLVCNRGDRVKVAHDIPMWGLGSGRVKNRIASNVFELDEDVIYKHGSFYTIRFRAADGSTSVANTISSAVITAVSRLNGLCTIVMDNTGHPFSKGDVLTVTMTAAGLYYYNASTEIVSVTDNSISFKTVESDLEEIVATGTIKLNDGYYPKVKLDTDLTETQANYSDLFLYGELNSESQDLIVLSIEPTTNKSARITLIDYGVTPTYNIFTDYKTLTENTVFESQITLPPKLLIDSLGTNVPRMTKLISDESVMEKISAGVFKYNLKVSYVNPKELPSSVASVQVQYDYASSTDNLNYRTNSVDYSSGSIVVPDVVEGETYKVRLRYVTLDGRFGKWSNWLTTYITGKTTAPSQVTNFQLFPEYTTGKLKLSWDSNPEIDIKGYEVRTQDAEWGTTENRVFLGNTTTCYTFSENSVESVTYYIRAFDYGGNYSASTASITFTSPKPNAPSGLSYAFGTTSATHSSVTFSWNVPVTSYFFVKEYKVTVTRPDSPDEILTTSATRYTTNADWLGNAILTVQSVDTLGGVSDPVTLTIPKYRPNPAVSFVTEVVDNNVLLRWSLPEKTSLPISHVLIRRGPTWEGYDKDIGEKSGTFTSIFELSGGEYVYWLAVVDTDGRESTPTPIAVTVSQPPDFVFNAEWLSTWSGTKTNSSLITNSNSLLMLVDTSKTWATHFSDRGWNSIQDIIDDTEEYNIYSQPSILGEAIYEEVFDYGQVLSSSSITVSYIGKVLYGTPDVYVQIETSMDGITWSTPQKVTALYATNFRKIRLKFSVTSHTDEDLYELQKLVVRLDNKQVSDSGNVNALSTDTLGTIVNFNKEIIDVQSVTITPAATTPLTAVYDLHDTNIEGTYSITSGIGTINATGHSLETGQNVRLVFTSGTALTGVYTITKVNANQYTVVMAGQANTTGSVITYPQSMRVYVFNSTTGVRQTSKTSWQIRGY